MSTHPPPEKDKDKEEYDKDDLTLFINSDKFDIGRVTEVGSIGVGKWEYDNDYTELSSIKSLFSSTYFSASLSSSLSAIVPPPPHPPYSYSVSAVSLSP